MNKKCCEKWTEAEYIMPYYGATSTITSSVRDMVIAMYCPECGCKLKKEITENEEEELKTTSKNLEEAINRRLVHAPITEELLKKKLKDKITIKGR